jgi:hypothetical protein
VTFSGKNYHCRFLLHFCFEPLAGFGYEGKGMRFDYTDGDPDKEAAFYILRHTVVTSPDFLWAILWAGFFSIFAY